MAGMSSHPFFLFFFVFAGATNRGKDSGEFHVATALKILEYDVRYLDMPCSKRSPVNVVCYVDMKT